MNRVLVIGVTVLLAACASNQPPPPEWQANARVAADRSVAAFLDGNSRVEAAELARARSEVARTGRADLAARVELMQCAAQVASLVFGPCAGFEALRADVEASLRNIDHLISEVNRKWPFAPDPRATELKLP